MRICPKPTPWDQACKRLTEYAQRYSCIPPSPPAPLILAGWSLSNDVDKMHRWEETVAWAVKNGCSHLVSDIRDQDFYCVEKPTSYEIGPLGGPMYRDWDFEAKPRPSSDQITEHMEVLRSRWSEIVGKEIACNTRPLAFTGKKARRLLVLADPGSMPPWGAWSRLFRQESERRTFTRFRAAINKAIAPHEVDHIDFLTEQ